MGRVQTEVPCGYKESTEDAQDKVDRRLTINNNNNNNTFVVCHSAIASEVLTEQVS